MTAELRAWQRRPLGELVDVLDARRVPVAAKERAARAGSIPYYGAAGRVGWIDDALFHEPLVLLGEDGVQFFDSSRTKAYRIDGPAWVNNHAHVLRAGDHIEWRYLEHYLNWFDYRGYANGTTRLKLTQGAMRRIPVILPPLNEQRRIVDILEDHLSRLDAADGLLGRSRIRARALEAALLESVIDVGAKRCHLGKLLSGVEAGRSFGGSAGPATAGQWGIIKVSAMTRGAFRPDENKAVPEAKVDPRFEIRPGDLLVSRANTTAYVGASVLVRSTPPRLLLSDKSLRLILHENVDPEWLVLALSAPKVRRQISARATGTKDSMRNISQAGLRSVEVPVRTLHQQREDATRAAQLLDASADMKAATRLHQNRTDLLRRSLLTAAFAGRLTGHSSDLERAEEMAR